MESAQATQPAEVMSPEKDATVDSEQEINDALDKTSDVDVALLDVQMENTNGKSEIQSDVSEVHNEVKSEEDLKAAVLDQLPIEEGVAAEITLRFQDLQTQDQEEEVELDANQSKPPQNDILSHVHCLAQLEEQRRSFEQQLDQLRTSNLQKDNMITLIQRENAILDKEKQAARKEMDMANKEKEATVIKFAMKEKLLIDAKKEKDTVEKQLAEAKKEVKNISTKFVAINEEKSRMTYIIDEKVGVLVHYVTRF